MVIGSYGIVFWTSYKVWRHLKYMEIHMSTQTRIAHHQMTKVMIAQALIPFFFNLLPIFTHIIFIILYINIDGVGLIVSLIFCWIPVMNSFTTIIVIKQYRKFIIGLYKRILCINVILTPVTSSVLVISSKNTINTVNHGIDLTKNPKAMQRLQEAAEKAKCELSTASETEISLPDIAGDSSGPKNLHTKITREQYEKIVDDLIQRIKEPCQKALNDAGIKSSDIKGILLYSGMSQMPKVQQFVHEIFGREPFIPTNPDEAVVRGAPIQASELSAEDIIEIMSDEFEYVMDKIHALLEEHFEKVNKRRMYEMIMFTVITVFLMMSNLENYRLKKIINNTPQ